MSTKYTFHPKRYMIGEMEKYYTDMAAKGWHLVKRGLLFSKFVKGESADMKYRVELVYKSDYINRRMNDEQLMVFEDCGWEFVTNDLFIHIFRAPSDSDTQEFYLDPAQQAQTLKGLRRELLLNSLQPAIMISTFLLLNFMTGEDIFSRLYLLWIARTQFSIAFIALLILTVANGLLSTVHLSLLYRRMKKGIPLDHSPKRKPFSISPLLIILCCVLLIISPSKFSETLPIQQDMPYLTLKDIGYGGATDTEKSNCAYYNSLLARVYDTRETMGSEWIFTETYMLENPSSSRNVAQSLMNTATFGRGGDKFTVIPFDGLDMVYINGDLEIVAVKGKMVCIITTIMDKEGDTEKVLTALAEKWRDF